MSKAGPNDLHYDPSLSEGSEGERRSCLLFVLSNLQLYREKNEDNPPVF